MGMMRAIGRATVLATGLAMGLLAGVWQANEQCQRLVARGQVAWSAGRVAAAEDLFSAAVAADPNDPEAQYGLGIALARQLRWAEAERALQRVLAVRPGDPLARRALDQLKARAQEEPAAAVGAPEVDSGRAWSVRGHASVGYDSNVPLLSHSSGGRRGDAVFQLGVGASVQAITLPRVRLVLDYDFDQSLHPRIQVYDLRSHRVGGTLSVSLLDGLWASLYGGVEHYSLGSHQYLLDPFVEPLLSYEWADVGVTQIFYRHGEPDYLSAPFKGIRSGQTNATGIAQTFYLGNPDRRLSAGYTFDDEDPRGGANNDYRRSGHDLLLGLQWPVGWQAVVDLSYAYRHDGYHDINTVHLPGALARRRADDVHTYGIGVERPLMDGLTVRLGYEGTASRSNIYLFDYRRHMVVLGVEAKY